MQPQRRVGGSGVWELIQTVPEKIKVTEWSETLLFVLPHVPHKTRRETVRFLDYLLTLAIRTLEIKSIPLPHITCRFHRWRS